MPGDDLSSISKANFALALGLQTRSFIAHCDRYRVALSDAAESEKSVKLRAYLKEVSKSVDEVIKKIEEVHVVE